MTKLEHYLADGADWQARGVLACLNDFIQALTDKAYDVGLKGHAVITVNRHCNGRAQGYTAELRIGIPNKCISHYTFFEHPNSDHIVIYKGVKPIVGFDPPTMEKIYGDRGKYDFDKQFMPGDVHNAAKSIADGMLKDMESFSKEHPDELKLLA